MARKKKRRSTKPTDEHSHLALRIEDHRVRATAGINHHAYNPQYAWRDTDDEPLYEFETHLEMKAVSTDPSTRAGESYALTIYGEANPESNLYLKLKDIQAVDEHRVPQYRIYRGKHIPIFNAPPGMGTLEKSRGATQWRGAIWVQPRYMSDLLVLLGRNQQLYLSIHERKIERQRWIQDIEVLTPDPAEE